MFRTPATKNASLGMVVSHMKNGDFARLAALQRKYGFVDFDHFRVSQDLTGTN
jgi:hypothetical protein